MSGELESSTIDLGGGVDFRNVVFEPLSQSPETGTSSLRFQIATTNSSTPEMWEYLGPDGTGTTYYDSVQTVVNQIHNGQKYLRYKVFLSTLNDDYSPLLSELAFTYTNSCTPPGQTFFPSLTAGQYNIEVTRSGYTIYTGTVDVSGRSDTSINLSLTE